MALIRGGVFTLAKQLGLLRLCRPGVVAHQQRFLTVDSSSGEENKNEHTHENDEREPDLGNPFMENEEEDVDTRRQILDAALQYVPEHGWSPKAISAGVQSLGLSSMAEGMFPRSAGDLVLHFIEDCNANLADHLRSSTQSTDDGEDHTESTKERNPQAIIQDALEVRLRMLIPFIDQWPQAMGLMLMPQNAPDAVKNVAYMVDEIWYHAGDTSTDINWYAKRGVLASLYGATEMYMVHDKSYDFEQTWGFLDRRMTDIKTMIQAKSMFEKAGSDTAELLSAAFTTVRNMSGFNSRNR